MKLDNFMQEPHLVIRPLDEDKRIDKDTAKDVIAYLETIAYRDHEDLFTLAETIVRCIGENGGMLFSDMSMTIAEMLYNYQTDTNEILSPELKELVTQRVWQLINELPRRVN